MSLLLDYGRRGPRSPHPLRVRRAGHPFTWVPAQGTSRVSEGPGWDPAGPDTSGHSDRAPRCALDAPRGPGPAFTRCGGGDQRAASAMVIKPAAEGHPQPGGTGARGGRLPSAPSKGSRRWSVSDGEDSAAKDRPAHDPGSLTADEKAELERQKDELERLRAEVADLRARPGPSDAASGGPV